MCLYALRYSRWRYAFFQFGLALQEIITETVNNWLNNVPVSTRCESLCDAYWQYRKTSSQPEIQEKKKKIFGNKQRDDDEEEKEVVVEEEEDNEQVTSGYGKKSTPELLILPELMLYV